MELANTVIVPAPPDRVWAALNDPEVLKDCVPGCESLEKSADNEYRAAMTARVGPVSAKFTGRMTMADIDAPHGYTLRFEGQGGPAGFASGEARVSLATAAGGQTSMSYAVTAQVGGKLAQIGSRLIDGAASKLASDFFARFIAHFAAPVQLPADSPTEPRAETMTTAAVDATPPVPVSERGTWTRFVAIAAIVVILAYLYFKGGRIH